MIKIIKLKPMGENGLKFWGSYFLNAVVLMIDVPVLIKSCLLVLAGALTVISLLNQISVMIDNLPKWKAYWWGKWQHAKVHGNKLKRILKNKSGGKL